MNASEKRRGGAAGSGPGTSGHVHRAGGTHPLHAGTRQGAAALHHHKTKEDDRDRDRDRDPESSPAGPAAMPTMPPRAAVNSTSATTPSPEETYDAGGGGGGGGGGPTGGGTLMTSSTAGGANSTGGAALTDRIDKDRDNDVGKDKERDSPAAAGGGAHRTNSVRSVAGSSSTSWGAASSKAKQRERDRELATAITQLQEREKQVAHLENEMTIMEHEFQRQLDKLSQNESETTTFWQTKYSQLNQQFLRTDTELRLLRNEVEARQEEREELRQGWEVLRRELKERDDDIRGLRTQVRGLKEFVSTSTRTDGQTCDEDLGVGMTRLGNGLQNWVITNFRKAKLDLSKADEVTVAEIGELVPMYEDLALTSKIHLLQAIVSAVLVEMVFDSYYVGLSDEEMAQFRQMEKLLVSFTGAHEPVNQWRSSTLALIRREAPQRLSQETTAFTERIMSRLNRLLDAVTSATPSENRDTALRVLVNNSIELARLLTVQKAVLRVYMPQILPHQRVLFEGESMEDIGGEDEESLAEREICCVAFPGLVKNGDEHGGHLQQYRNVITKARVLCSPEI